MLSPRGARGVEKAELNGNVDSDNNHGGSSRTYVLHRAGCSQEDDQLLRQGCEWSSSPGRQAWGNAPRAGHLDDMQGGLKNTYDSIKAFSETDFTEDLKKFDVPTLVMHGEDDQVVPIKDSAKKSARLIKGAKEVYYPGRPHGLTATHQDEVNTDLLKFLRSVQQARKAAA